MCGTLRRLPFASRMAWSRKRCTCPGKIPRHGVSPSSLASNSICRPRQIPRKGRDGASSFTTGPSRLLQRALGRRQYPGLPRIELDCHAQCTGKSLEHRLALMMGVAAAQVVDVQRDQRVVHEALEKFVGEVDVELPDHRPDELDL